MSTMSSTPGTSTALHHLREVPVPGTGTDKPLQRGTAPFRIGKTKSVFMPFAQPGGLILPHTCRGKQVSIARGSAPQQPQPYSALCCYQPQQLVHLQQQPQQMTPAGNSMYTGPQAAPGSMYTPLGLQSQHLTAVVGADRPAAAQPGPPAIQVLTLGGAATTASNAAMQQQPMQLVLAAPPAAGSMGGMPDASVSAPMLVLQAAAPQQPPQQVVFSATVRGGCVSTQQGMVLLNQQGGSVLGPQHTLVQPQQRPQFVQGVTPSPAMGYSTGGGSAPAFIIVQH